MAVQLWESSEEQRLREALPVNKLMAYCERCEEWYKFDSKTDSGKCTTCGGKCSNKIGYQMTTQRSFNPAAKKMTKAQLKKMGGLS